MAQIGEPEGGEEIIRRAPDRELIPEEAPIKEQPPVKEPEKVPA